MPFVTRGRWFGGAERPLLGWWTTPAAGPSRDGVLIVPPIGYEYWSSHRTLRTLAEQLAGDGSTVLRFDYDGTGDSAGDAWDGARVTAWRRSVAAAVAELRAAGIERLTLVGLRLGATFALADGAALGADAIVAWVPVTSGRRFAKEMRMLGLAVPATSARPEPGGAVTFAGVVFAAETIAELGKLDVEQLAARPAARVLVVARPDRPADKLVARLRELGSDTTLATIAGSETALDVPAEDATVPYASLDAIAAWIGDARRTDDAAPPTTATTTTAPAAPTHSRLPWRTGAIDEAIVTLGASALVAITARAAATGAAGATAATSIVFLNSGSEPHVGPGRAWVDYARDLALAGHTTIRLDFRGWGESPDDAHAPGRPYDAHCVADTIDAVTALRAAGHQRIVLVGLCAGAWVGLRAALQTRVDAVIAINPQLYWEPGQPVEALLTDTRVRRTAEREREERGGRNGLWSALDAIGIRPSAARWLTALRRAHTRTLMLFAAGDDGLEFLRNRVARRLRHELAAGFVELTELADIDHQMYREWRRADVVAELRRFVDALPVATPGFARRSRSS